MNIRRQPNGQYAVDSETSEKSYVVTKTSCSCPHHTYRGAHCKHMAALEAHLEEQTALGRAADKAAGLSDADLMSYAQKRNGTAAGAACLLELAARVAHIRSIIDEDAPTPREIPAGVLALLEGATEAEQERALAVYR